MVHEIWRILTFLLRFTGIPSGSSLTHSPSLEAMLFRSELLEERLSREGIILLYIDFQCPSSALLKQFPRCSRHHRCVLFPPPPPPHQPRHSSKHKQQHLRDLDSHSLDLSRNSLHSTTGGGGGEGRGRVSSSSSSSSSSAHYHHHLLWEHVCREAMEAHAVSLSHTKLVSLPPLATLKGSHLFWSSKKERERSTIAPGQFFFFG